MTRRIFGGALVGTAARTGMAHLFQDGDLSVRRPVSEFLKSEENRDILVAAYRQLDLQARHPWHLKAIERLHGAVCSSTLNSPGAPASSHVAGGDQQCYVLDHKHEDIHNTWSFLPWHRALVCLHERVLRQCLRELDEHRQSADRFCLPYWDWEAGVPDFYYEKKYNGKPNPLLIRGRGNTLPNINACLEKTQYKAMMGTCKFADQKVRSFAGGSNKQGKSFAGPHACVHQVIPTLKTPAIAAGDPLFFIHHASIDRMWAIWANQHWPVDYPADWSSESHVFPPLAPGRECVTVQNRDLADTKRLGYTYDNLRPPIEIKCESQPLSASPATISPLSVWSDRSLKSEARVLLRKAEDLRRKSAAGFVPEVYLTFEGVRLKSSQTGSLYSFWLVSTPKPYSLGKFGFFADPAAEIEVQVSAVVPIAEFSKIIGSAWLPWRKPGLELRYSEGELPVERSEIARFRAVTADVISSRVSPQWPWPKPQ